ncbi:MAG: ribosome maturation factor RimM [Candidatus Sedimenticola endophacoides]|uniref:Ribosome maturation factor RimM n=1 Tax=Candidatus Sedimenticola endophacoides TaxID=2548426 RepID=A0A657PW45_9GAMM|nr:MAG: ribosome maturation factor RimM [Candidatus Sedimenticola endophacoides]OQX37356.1 MAG: ribosome maturation factor RimM [Candidatus Sedimenticola endophacoides]OQX39242.1 MAG: ribosome maturation factor RimM [Candidatus Sedimenticola endophacoides]OQX43471.1 MAG: ribosome maturation factor RimM [Candidatus Sedimenticola endophacoides]OQX44542.1 MAG: ribosome maturation factor RimM [Candidatus Sedimenticola endophacoides]
MRDDGGREKGGALPPVSDTQWVILGRVTGLFGVRGWVKVFSDTAPRTNIFTYPAWYLRRGEEWRPYRLVQGKPQGKGLVASLEGVDERDRAAELIGAEIAIPRERLPETGEDEYYWTDLEGLRVETLEGRDLGRIDHLFETGANDVMVVEGERQRLIPFIPDVIVEVSLARRRMVVDWDPEF